ncbi:MAG TPA: Ger(x)C family spore germination protein [Symbiobacteriaceae bacterium]|nr:Ger(x)C family spore germination protein [Symbiobacteriaceae bacterium]
MRRWVAVSLMLSLLLTGCWSRKELQELNFVTAIGLDWNEETEQIDLTIQIVRLLFVPRPGEKTGGTPEERPYHFLHASGRTTAEALNRAQQSQSRRLYFSHLQVVVFGKEMAEHGVSDPMNLFWRHTEVRPYIDVAVARGRARELLAGQSPQGDVTGRWIVELLEQARAHGYTRSVPMLEAMYAMTEPGLAPYMPVLHLTSTGSPDPATAADIPTQEAVGVAVFDRDRMVGFLKPEESRGAILARGRSRTLVLTVAAGKDDGELTSFAVREVRPEIKVGPPSASGLPSVTLRIAARGELLQRQRIPEPIPPEDVPRIEKAIAAQLKQQVMSAVTTTKKLKSDVIGFAEALRQQNPALWHRVMHKWDDRYPDLPVKVEVNVTLRRTGILR